MSDGQGDNPARVIYDSLVSELRPTAARYRMLIAALRPLWIEEVVCPVNIAVRELCRAAEAAESGNETTRHAHHEAARAQLYQALSTARLLTLEERLQEVVVNDLLGDAPSGDGSLRTLDDTWGWRAH